MAKYNVEGRIGFIWANPRYIYICRIVCVDRIGSIIGLMLFKLVE